MKHTGACHCKKIQFEAEMEIKEMMSCNCSICSKRGHLLAFTPESTFKAISKDGLSDYQWGKKSIHFYFCSTCGVAPFGAAKMPDGAEMRAINVRCLDNFDLAKIPITYFNGKDL